LDFGRDYEPAKLKTVDSKEHLDNLKRTVAASIERAKQNSEDLQGIEQALREFGKA
jgi:hypothetical protein